VYEGSNAAVRPNTAVIADPAEVPWTTARTVIVETESRVAAPTFAVSPCMELEESRRAPDAPSRAPAAARDEAETRKAAEVVDVGAGTAVIVLEEDIVAVAGATARPEAEREPAEVSTTAAVVVLRASAPIVDPELIVDVEDPAAVTVADSADVESRRAPAGAVTVAAAVSELLEASGAAPNAVPVPAAPRDDPDVIAADRAAAAPGAAVRELDEERVAVPGSTARAPAVRELDEARAAAETA
jgi:hypothetical protein